MHPRIAVACGVLVNARGEVLIAQRPAGKIAAGQWEFPGGKIEAGETARDALVRELHEELGISVRTARPLIRVTHAYTDRTVALDTWRISAFEGEPHGRENQAFAWVRPDRLHDYPLLAADKPIVTALRLPSDYVFTPPSSDPQLLLRGLERLPRGALLRLRQPALDDNVYVRVAQSLLAPCRDLGLSLMLDRRPMFCREVDAAGWHATATELHKLTHRPVPAHQWFGASVHNEMELYKARSLGADFIVLGAIKETASHPGETGMGWKKFEQLTAEANCPVYAIGGVGPRDQPQVFEHYAQGTAGISAYWSVSSSSANPSLPSTGTL